LLEVVNILRWLSAAPGAQQAGARAPEFILQRMLQGLIPLPCETKRPPWTVGPLKSFDIFIIRLPGRGADLRTAWVRSS